MFEGGMVTRRRLLAASGLGAFGIALGAISLYDPTTLRYIGVDNRTDTEQTVEVRVDASGDRVFEREIRVGSHEHTQVPCEWPVPAGRYSVGARLDDGGEWTADSIRDGGNAYRRITIEEGGLEIYSLTPGPDYFDAREDITLCEIPWWVGEFRSDSS